MRWAAIVLGLIAIWLAGVSAWVAIGPPSDRAARADVAVVLGAAVDTDTPSPVFEARIDHAIDLYRNGQVSGLIFTGARSADDVLSEAAAARDYAIGEGVVPTAIAIEERSRTTRQNIIEAQRVMIAEGHTTALLVSDPLHLRRASMMADDLGVEAQPSATPMTRYRSWSVKIPFLLREVYFVHHYWAFGE